MEPWISSILGTDACAVTVPRIPSIAVGSPIRKRAAWGNVGSSVVSPAFWCMVASKRFTVAPLTCNTASKSPVSALDQVRIVSQKPATRGRR